MVDQVVGPLDIVRGEQAYALRPATCVLAKSLAASTAESFTVPTNAKFVLFEKTSGVDFYANYTTTATVPGDTAITDATASEMNPAMRFIGGVTTISVISAATCIITASFWTD